MSKSAFSMLELVIVIVTIGILAAAALPRLERNVVREAAVQLANHIRYTQHLAMVDDKYDGADPIWFQRRWQMMFVKNLGSSNKWSYTIFSDYLGGASGNPDPAEVAVNPLNPAKRLTGGTSGNLIIHFGDDQMTQEMNLEAHFGIVSIERKNCGGGNLRLSFDHLGRPFVGALQEKGAPYGGGGAGRLLVGSPCIITISDGKESASIAIEPETGYVHIL